MKRPASAQGGEEKRQRTEAPRVPGWKAKAAEAVDVTDQFALEDVNSEWAIVGISVLRKMCKKCCSCFLIPFAFIGPFHRHVQVPLTC